MLQGNFSNDIPCIVVLSSLYQMLLAFQIHHLLQEIFPDLLLFPRPRLEALLICFHGPLCLLTSGWGSNVPKVPVYLPVSPLD